MFAKIQRDFAAINFLNTLSEQTVITKGIGLINYKMEE